MNKLHVETAGDREIIMRRAFDAPRHLVWEAYTNPELLKRWLLGPPDWSMIVCEVDLRVGGKFRFVWRKTGGTEMGMGGEYREVVAPERITQTELFDQDWTDGEAISRLVLTEENGGTVATTTVTYVSKETRDAVLQSGMADGVGISYDRLEKMLLEEAA